MKGALVLGTLLCAVACSSGKKALPSGPGPAAPLPGSFADGGSGGSGAGDGAGDAGAPAGGVGEPGGPPVGDPPGEMAPCNGRVEYCALPYDAFSQLATHDSAATSSVYWDAPTQDQPLRTQLDRGVRTLLLAVTQHSGAISVCRAACEDGNTPLSVVLADVKAFMDDNPREVVTVLVETDLDAGTLGGAFVDAGLAALAYSRSADAPWPTLGELVDAGSRLLVLARTSDPSADAADAPAWLLPRATLVFETGVRFTTLRDMSCTPAVGDAAMPLFLLHQSLVELDAGAPDDDPGRPSSDLSAQVNAFDVATERAQRCEIELGHVPNFVAVDFFEQGDPGGATQVVNGVRAAPSGP